MIAVVPFGLILETCMTIYLRGFNCMLLQFVQFSSSITLSLSGAITPIQVLLFKKKNAVLQVALLNIFRCAGSVHFVSNCV